MPRSLEDGEGWVRPAKSTCLRIATQAERAAASVLHAPDHEQLKEIAKYWRELGAQDQAEFESLKTEIIPPSPAAFPTLEERADALVVQLAEALRSEPGLTIDHVREAIGRRFGPGPV